MTSPNTFLVALPLALSAALAGCGGPDTICGDSEHELYDPDTKRCYMREHRAKRDWQGAREECAEWGGDLAVLDTLEELAMVVEFIDDGEDGRTAYWIGASDAASEGTFQWIDGQPWTYVPHEPPWYEDAFSDEPNDRPHPDTGQGEDCVELYDNGTLNDENCTDSELYVCEREQIAN